MPPRLVILVPFTVIELALDATIMCCSLVPELVKLTDSTVSGFEEG